MTHFFSHHYCNCLWCVTLWPCRHCNPLVSGSNIQTPYRCWDTMGLYCPTVCPGAKAILILQTRPLSSNPDELGSIFMHCVNDIYLPWGNKWVIVYRGFCAEVCDEVSAVTCCLSHHCCSCWWCVALWPCRRCEQSSTFSNFLLAPVSCGWLWPFDPIFKSWTTIICCSQIYFSSKYQQGSPSWFCVYLTSVGCCKTLLVEHIFSLQKTRGTYSSDAVFIELSSNAVKKKKRFAF